MSGDSATVHNRALIVNNLSILAKEKCMLSAFLGGKDTILTAVINVNIKEGTVVFDTSPSEKLNAKLLATRVVKFSAVFNGVQVAFSGESVKKTKHGGYDAFVMPLPSSIYWFDRRGAYRVNAPTTTNTSFCKIIIPPPDENAKAEYKTNYKITTDKIRAQLVKQMEADFVVEQQNFARAYAKMTPEEKTTAKLERQKLEKERKENPPVPDENLVNIFQLKLVDVSITGCAAVNYNEDFSYFLNKNSLYENCILIMPDHGEATVNLEIMLKRVVEHEHEHEHEVKSDKFEEFIGFKFIDPKQSDESIIFRYIQALDRLMKKK
jgi:c-di-GMP-binding flagellar brake protein YcgR